MKVFVISVKLGIQIILEIMWQLINWFSIFTFLTIILYLIGTRNYDFYSKRKTAFVTPIPFLGNLAPMIMKKMSPSEHLIWIYNELKQHKFGGFFGFSTHALLLRDPDIIKNVCISSFDCFMDRKTLLMEDYEPISHIVLPSLTGKRWRHVRSIMSTAFSPNKIKEMFPRMSASALKFVEFLGQQFYNPSHKGIKIYAGDGVLEVEMTDVCSRCCTDILILSTLGINCDSFQYPENDIYKMGQIITNFEGRKAFVLLGYLLSPKLMKLLRLTIVDTDAVNFFRTLVYDTIAERKSDGIVRNDVLHLLMQAQITNHALDSVDSFALDDDTIAAQIMLVFIAGLETLTTLLCCATNLLAVHQDVQARLLSDIQLLSKEKGRRVDYEDLHKLKYLDTVISETLRLYPPTDVIDRTCVKPYTIPATESSPEYTFEEGEGLVIPLYAIHRDPNHFPEPDQFVPERFSHVNRHQIKPFTYLPFGLGPRNCLGVKFAKTLAKLILVNLLLRFELHVVDRTPVPIRLAKMCFNKRAEGGFWVGLKPHQTEDFI